jgi:hypothetical protein
MRRTAAKTGPWRRAHFAEFTFAVIVVSYWAISWGSTIYRRSVFMWLFNSSSFFSSRFWREIISHMKMKKTRNANP